MLALIRPHLRFSGVCRISHTHLTSRNLNGLLLDVDCTLKDYYSSTFPDTVTTWIHKMQEAGIKLCLFSNGKAQRIEPLAKKIGLPFIAPAMKPLPFACKSAAEILDLPVNQLAMVGDQLFADILFGRLAGLFTILVEPTTSKEPFFTSVKRPLERWLLRTFIDNLVEQRLCPEAHSDRH